MKRALFAVVLAACLPLTALAQPVHNEDLDAKLDRVLSVLEGFRHRLDALEKRVDDGLWFDRVGDVAFIDKVRLYGPPRWKEESETAIGAGNPLKFWAYVFVPRGIDTSAKAPLLV